MIHVVINLPMLDKSFDFRLEEDAKIEEVTEEIAEVVCQHEQCTLAGQQEDLILCKPAQHRILAAGMTLAQCGVQTGDLLTLL